MHPQSGKAPVILSGSKCLLGVAPTLTPAPASRPPCQPGTVAHSGIYRKFLVCYTSLLTGVRSPPSGARSHPRPLSQGYFHARAAGSTQLFLAPLVSLLSYLCSMLSF